MTQESPSNRGVRWHFRGHVEKVGFYVARLRMRDVTQPENPDEEWVVDLAKLPKHPRVGERLTFTIEHERGIFKFDMLRKWTAEEIGEIKQRARQLSERLGIDYP
jgi:hypothetical protein